MVDVLCVRPNVDAVVTGDPVRCGGGVSDCAGAVKPRCERVVKGLQI
jgi:hypothetical protein